MFFDEPNEGRFKILFGLFAAAVFVCVCALVWYQVIRAGELTERAAGVRTWKMTLRGHRGTIYDRNGNVLAMDEECATVYCNPGEVEKPDEVAAVIAEHLGGEAKDYASILTSDAPFAYVKRQVSNEDADAIEAELKEKGLAGVHLEADTRRVYPYKEVAGQILGVVNADGVGITGLELQYEDILHGTDGARYIENGANGVPISDATPTIEEPKEGTDIVISLDINVQRVAERGIVKGVEDYSAESGSVMVMNPQTGEILAACSTPLLDLTDRAHIEDGATSLKLVSDSYEPGSIFKILTASMAIEQGAIKPEESMYIPAHVQVGGDIVSDDDGREEDMYMTMREILRRSSNAGAAVVAQDRIGADGFARGVEVFGIGKPTGIDFPGETPGLVKQRDEYDGSSVGSMSFGQGLAIPLVQMVRAIGAVGNHGIAMTPHFLVYAGTEAKDWGEGERLVSSTTATDVVDMMRTVMKEGTGVPAQVQGYDIAGKTGTGERADTEHGGYIEFCYTSSLIGFAPASNPNVLAYVGLNGTPHLAYDSAAPLFSTIMGEALTDMGILPDA